MLKYIAEIKQYMNIVITVKAKKKSLIQQVTLLNSVLSGFHPVSNFWLSTKIQGLFKKSFAMYVELPQ